MKTEKEKVVTKEVKPAKKVSKTWEAMQKLRGSLIVNAPAFLL